MERRTMRWRPACTVPTVMAALLLAGVPSGALAYTPKSPEVQKLIARAIAFLETSGATDNRLGAQALLGLALVKNGADAKHPVVAQAAATISDAVNGGREGVQFGADNSMYSIGLSAIFLVTLEPTSTGPHAPVVEKLLELLRTRQKPHGGWGYLERPKGDTSMTQYGVLAYWEAAQIGYSVPQDSIKAVTEWLMRTQDPSGAFGYQGNVSPSFEPVPQAEIRSSLAAAGLGSAHICADLLGFSQLSKEREEKLPQALKEMRSKGAKAHVSPSLLREVLARGNRWMAARAQAPTVGKYTYAYYYLYAMERYYSFREAVEGQSEAEPRWYNDGVRFLTETQAQDGSWSCDCGKMSDTAFGVLFLLRSAKKSIEKAKDYGSGTLVGGRDLGRLARELEGGPGKAGTKSLLGSLEQLLSGMEDMEYQEADEALDSLAELPVEETRALVSKHTARLRQLAGGSSPEARAAAIRALAKTRNLDYVPLLIFALGDADPRVVREANDGLCRISGRLAGGSLPDPLTDTERQEVIKRWKTWFLGVRPDTQFEN